MEREEAAVRLVDGFDLGHGGLTDIERRSEGANRDRPRGLHDEADSLLKPRELGAEVPMLRRLDPGQGAGNREHLG